MLKSCFVFLLLSVCLLQSDGQLAIPLPGLSASANLGGTLGGALGTAMGGPLGGMLGSAVGSGLHNSLSGTQGSNPLDLSGLATAAQGIIDSIGSMMSNISLPNMTNAIETAINSTRELLTTLVQLKIQLYEAKENYYNSHNFSASGGLGDLSGTTPASNSDGASSSGGASNVAGGGSSSLGSALTGATNALGGLTSGLGSALRGGGEAAGGSGTGSGSGQGGLSGGLAGGIGLAGGVGGRLG